MHMKAELSQNLQFLLRRGLILQSQPSECGRQHTLNIVHGQTAAQRQANGSYEARMSGKFGKGRD